MIMFIYDTSDIVGLAVVITLISIYLLSFLINFTLNIYGKLGHFIAKLLHALGMRK